MAKAASNVKPQLLELLVAVEQGVGRLYKLFATRFPEDRSFWRSLATEETHHASILEDVGTYLRAKEILPRGGVTEGLRGLGALIARLEQHQEQLAAKPPTRSRALALALELERSAGERHFQMILDSQDDNPASVVIRRLVHDDRDHAARIDAYRKDKGLG